MPMKKKKSMFKKKKKGGAFGKRNKLGVQPVTVIHPKSNHPPSIYTRKSAILSSRAKCCWKAFGIAFFIIGILFIFIGGLVFALDDQRTDGNSVGMYGLIIGLVGGFTLLFMTGMSYNAISGSRIEENQVAPRDNVEKGGMDESGGEEDTDDSDADETPDGIYDETCGDFTGQPTSISDPQDQISTTTPSTTTQQDIEAEGIGDPLVQDAETGIRAEVKQENQMLEVEQELARAQKEENGSENQESNTQEANGKVIENKDTEMDLA